MVQFRRAARAYTFAALLAAGMGAGVAQAADPSYPTRPVRMVVGFTPGGTTDALARLMATRLAAAMGQPWLVENRGGAGGNLGTAAVVGAAPDGYTVMFALDTQLTANPSLYKLAFDVQTALQPVTMLAKFENVLTVSPSVPAQNLQELVALVKKHPERFNYASSGVGGTLHLASEMFKNQAGIEMRHVPYKGAVPAITGVLSGETQVMIGAIPSTLSHVNSGRLRALATTGAKRSPLTPNLPTVAESGYPGFESIGWFALAVPTGTPAGIVTKIRDEALKILDDPEFRATMAARGLEAQSSTPAELVTRIKMETAAIAEVVKRVGILPE